MAHVVDWDNVTKDDIVRLHEWGRDAEAYRNGAGDMMDSYLESIEKGTTWNPNDMSGVPATPVASRLDSDGNRVSLAEVPEEELPPYTEWSREDLEAEAEARGLSKEGSDEELAVRLLEDDDQAAEETQKSYSSMKKDELQAECRNRGLSDEGRVDDLRTRLQEDDATRSE